MAGHHQTKHREFTITADMDVWAETSWFAVQSRPYREALAAAGLAHLGLNVLLPRIRQEQLVCGTWRRVSRPLFPGYLFARFCPVTALESVRYSRGVLRVVGTMRCPTAVDTEVIASIRERVQTDGYIRLEPDPLIPGEEVEIQRGPLAGWMGRVEREWDDGRRVAILLETIHQARVAIDRRCLTRTAGAI